MPVAGRWLVGRRGVPERDLKAQSMRFSEITGSTGGSPINLG
jgi:hypothetical protein